MEFNNGDQVTSFEYMGIKYSTVKNHESHIGRCYKTIEGVDVFISNAEYNRVHALYTKGRFDLYKISKEVASGIKGRGVDFKTKAEVNEYANEYGWDAEIDEFGPEGIYKRTDSENEELMRLIAEILSKGLPEGKSSEPSGIFTDKQADFIKQTMKSDAWEGIDGVVWIDMLVDTIGGQFHNKPMTIGAMVSTLQAKGLIRVNSTRMDGRRVRSFVITEQGKVTLRENGFM